MAPPLPMGSTLTMHSRLLGDFAWNILLLSFHLIYSYLSFTSLLKHYLSEEEASLEVPITSQAGSGGGVFSLTTGAFLHLQIHSFHFSPASSLPEGSQRQACSWWHPRLQHRASNREGLHDTPVTGRNRFPGPQPTPAPLAQGLPYRLVDPL